VTEHFPAEERFGLIGQLRLLARELGHLSPARHRELDAEVKRMLHATAKGEPLIAYANPLNRTRQCCGTQHSIWFRLCRVRFLNEATL